MVSRFGTSFNFNLGEAKAWTINVRPAIVYQMSGNRSQILNVNKSAIELLAGVTYHLQVVMESITKQFRLHTTRLKLIC